jgi:tetratricopeptide (TPR) repeat protein
MKKIRFVLLFIFFIHVYDAYGYYEFDPQLEKAYGYIIALKFPEANELLANEKRSKPGNNLTLLYLNYIDFLKAFITEEQSDFETLKKNSAIRINQLDKDKENVKSPFHLYAKSEMLIQQALVRIKFSENVISAGEIRSAYKLIEKNQQLFPSFILNKKVYGFLTTIIGAVPQKYNWVLKVAGMTGNTAEGIRELKSLYESLSKNDFHSYQTEILFYIGNFYSAFSISDSVSITRLLSSSVNVSPLIVYVYTNILMKTGKNEQALEILDRTLKNYSSFPFVFLRYKLGLAKLRKLNLTAATDFDFFIMNFKGENNLKSAYQKKAWIELLKGNSEGYNNYLDNIKKTGAVLLDEDKDADYEARNNLIPNIYLLRARLLFDGGYYADAIAELTNRDISQYPSYRDKLEFTYRLGRIMQMTGQTEKAITYFQNTIKNSEQSRFYYAGNSCLMLGQIYEQKREFEKARLYYKKCLQMECDQYKNSIDQKAQAGLDRLK